MKCILLTSIGVFTYVIGICQTKTSDNKNFTLLREIDSSGYFLTGELPNKANRLKYNLISRDEFNYSPREVLYWTNALIINTANGQTTKHFSTGLNAVYPVSNTVEINKYDWTYNSYQRTPVSGMSKTHLIFLVKSDELNKDGVLDDEDPISIYLTDKKGNGLKRITESSMNVVGWSLSKDCKTIIALIQVDKNGDKKFSDEEEALFIIKLEEDFSKIKLAKVIE